jgi:small subunit ribosomal protein S20
MPVTKSAIKAMKQTQKANIRNKATKADFRGKIKAVKKAFTAGEKELGEVTSKAFQAIDKAAKHGVIHKNTAARRKSRLMLALNKSLEKTVELVSIKEKPTTAKKPATTKAKTLVKKTTK